MATTPASLSSPLQGYETRTSSSAIRTIGTVTLTECTEKCTHTRLHLPGGYAPACVTGAHPHASLALLALAELDGLCHTWLLRVEIEGKQLPRSLAGIKFGPDSTEPSLVRVTDTQLLRVARLLFVTSAAEPRERLRLFRCSGCC